MASDVVLRHERTLPHPRDAAFTWLTDYQAGDASRTEAVLEAREVVEDDEEGTIVLADRVRSLGLARQVQTIVELDPPDAWRARVHETHEAPPDVYTYELEALDEHRTRLTVTYRYRGLSLPEAVLLRLLSPIVRRRIARMWDGFAAAMDTELGGG